MFRACCVAALAIAACAQIPTTSTTSTTTTHTAALSTPPCTARTLGAIPDDGLDDRVALQAALDAHCADTLEAGTYDVVTPAPRRPPWSLSMPADSTLAGVGDATVLRCSGADGGLDWRCIEAGDRTHITRLRLDVELDPTQEEQTHAIRITGPRSNVRIDHLTIHHPVCAGSSMGDCLQIVGRQLTEVTDVVIDHVLFLACARSGIAVHSGLRGFRITNNRFIDIADQDIDEEGSGDIGDGEIAWNTFDVGPSHQSALGVSIYAADTHRVHDNAFNGRGLDLYGCNGCEVDHNRITQSQATGDAALMLRKTSHVVSLHDNTITRDATAGPGAVVEVTQRIGAPDHVTIADSTIVQHARGAAISAIGIVALSLERVSVTGEVPGGIAVDFAGTATITTTDLHVVDSTITGPWTAAIRLIGAYAGGAGTLDVTRVRSAGATQGLRCEDVVPEVMASGFVIGGISGPVAYRDNHMPAPVCAGLIGAP